MTALAPVAAPAGFRGSFRTDPVALAVYSEAAGIGRIMPRAIAVPHSPDDVSVLVTWARARGLSLIPRGSGSSMAGGAIGDGVIMDLSRLRTLAAPSQTTRSIHAQSGVLRGELDRRARSVGLRFPVDPSSGEFCTVGGMAATNAAGAHSLLHGPMRPWVLSLDCVFDDGSQARVRRGEPAPDVPAVSRFLANVHADALALGGAPTAKHAVLKNSSGYGVRAYAQTQELTDLLVGSEGTLVVFTGVEVALIPIPGATSGALVSFRDLQGAVEAAIAARSMGASACELLDRTFLKIASRGGASFPVSPDADAVLLIEVEGDSEPDAHATAMAILASCREFGVLEAHVASDAAREAELWAFRHAASPAIARLDPRLRSMQFIEDAAVPPESMAAYVRGVRAILEQSQTDGVIFGHAGDAHVHVNPLIDTSHPDWRLRLERILMDVTALVAQLGGSLSGEHGDGRLRTPLLDQVWPAEYLAIFRSVKQAFDPENVFNPGVKIPLAGQRAVDLVKYDPALAELPQAAGNALQAVERERAYARFRLDLL